MRYKYPVMTMHLDSGRVIEVVMDPCGPWPSEMIVGNMITRDTAMIVHLETMLDNIVMLWIDGP